MRPQVEVLKHHADIGAHRSGVASDLGPARGLLHGSAIDANGTFGRLLQQR
jgi:hypothetical protein